MSTLTATIQADTSGFNAAVEKASKELKLFDKSNKNLASTMKSVNKVTDSQVDAFNKSIKSLKQVADGNKNNQQSAKILKDELEKLNRQWRNLSEEAKKGQFGKAMSEAMRTANTELSKLKVNVDGASDKLKQLNSTSSNSFSSLLPVVTKFVGTLSAVDIAYNAINTAVKNNETVWDSWQETLEGAGTAWRNFTRNFSLSNIGGSFSAGVSFYQASDALGSFRALDKDRLSKIEERIQKAKTNKKEGIVLSDKKKLALEKDVISYYTDEANHLKNVANAKKGTILALFSDNEKATAEKFFTGLDATNSKFIYLEGYKTRYNELKNKIGENEKKHSKEIIDANGVRRTIVMPYARSEEEKGWVKERDTLKKLIDSEGDISEYVKLQSEVSLSEKEKQRQLGEVLEAATISKSTEKDIKETIQKLHDRNKALKEKINNALNKLNDPTEKDTVDLNQLKAWQTEVVKNREELLKLYNTFESTPVKKYWELVTKYDNALLYGEKDYIDKAITKDIENYVKELLDLGYTVQEVWKMIEESRKISHRYDNAGEGDKPIGLIALMAMERKLNIEKNKTTKNAKSIDAKSIDEQIIKLFSSAKLKSIQIQNEKLNNQATVVNTLSQAWSNLWGAIDDGSYVVPKVLNSVGGAVSDLANMYISLAKNELAASEAVALGKANASSAGLPPPYNLIAMATVTATITSMFSRFATIGKFAEGGIVGGSSTIGDYNIARVNSGEMILNGSQQKRLFNMLNSEGSPNATTSQPQRVELVIRGKDLVGTLNNYNNRLNRVR